ncbi:MAG: S8 family serine peptidase [Planctomycetota bacterium]
MSLKHAFLRCLSLGLAVSLGSLGLLGSVRAAPQDESLADTIRRDGAVRVYVRLQTAQNVSGTVSSTASSSGFRSLQDAVVESFPAEDMRGSYRFRFSPSIAVTISSSDVLTALERDPRVASVERVERGSIALAESKAVVRANEAADMGFSGTGTTVAVIDTGIDSNHADFEDAIVHTWTILDGQESSGADDRNGHGSHVSGILASRGNQSAPGVAPEAEIVAIKAVQDDGFASESDWGQAVEYLVALHDAENGIRLDAINMSLQSAGGYSTVCDDAFPEFAAACTAAWERGIAVFSAAGNRFFRTRIAAPACFSSSVSVGAVGDDELFESYSNRVPELDFVAPGTNVVAPTNDGGIASDTGTSQAAPHCAGLALLLREADPSIESAEIVAVMKRTGVPVEDPVTGDFYPLIDCAAALDLVREDCNGDLRSDFLTLLRRDVPCLDVELSAICDVVRDGDCNLNCVSDAVDIQAGTSLDLDEDGRPDECLPFRRGDANNDDAVDISDALIILSLLFLGDDPLPCAVAGDANDDDRVDISDAVSVLGFLFLGGPAFPVLGFGDCAADATPGTLSCQASLCR